MSECDGYRKIRGWINSTELAIRQIIIWCAVLTIGLLAIAFKS